MPHFSLTPVSALKPVDRNSACPDPDVDGAVMALRGELCLEIAWESLLRDWGRSKELPSGLIVDFYRRKHAIGADQDTRLVVSVGNRRVERVILKENAPNSGVCLFTGDLEERTFTMRIEVDHCNGEKAVFHPECYGVRLFLFRKSELWEEIEDRLIWIFSAARSGTSWLASMLCSLDGVQPMDETGVGRLLGAHRWEPERFFPIDDRYYQPWETTPEVVDGEIVVPQEDRRPFARLLTAWANQAQFASNERTVDTLKYAVRDHTFQQIVKEWGVGYLRAAVFKCPNDTHGADFFGAWFPGSRIILAMRDGRDSMASRFSPFGSQALAKTRDKRLREHAVIWYAHFWNFQIDIARAAVDQHDPERQGIIRFEDLRADPDTQLARAFEISGLEIDARRLDRIIRQHDISRIPDTEKGSDKPVQEGRNGGFRREFSRAEIALMNAIMEPNLRRFGYKV